MKDCLFCKITNKDIDSEIILENDNFLAFKDIHPKASVHVLIVPKRHIESVNHATEDEVDVLGEMFLTAKEAAKNLGVSSGYRLQVSVGRDGGQEIDHIHMHLLADEEGKEVFLK